MRPFAGLLLLLAVQPHLYSESSLTSLTPVTVVLDYEHPQAPLSYAAMRDGLHKLLRSAGLNISLREKTEFGSAAVDGSLLVFKMKGTCTAAAVPLGALSDERGPLAMAYMSDNQMLSFGEVECDRIRQSLRTVMEPGAPSGRYQPLYGSALAVVMAHEIYHMLAKEPRHTREGVTKPSLSARELLQQDLTLPAAARAAIQHELALLP